MFRDRAPFPHRLPIPATSWGPAAIVGLSCWLVLANLATARAQPTFADVEPILDANCVVCHSGDAAPLGLRLDDRGALMEGSANGPVVVPGDAEASELVRRIRGTSLPRMPLTGPPFLPDEEIERIAAWITAGAPGAADADGDEADPPSDSVEADPEITFGDVEPILTRRCASCHTDGGLLGRPPEGLRLDGYAAVLSGSDRVVVVPGDPAASELMRRIVGRALPRMPLDGPPYLDPDQVAAMRAWIEAGAPDADGRPASVPTGAEVRLHGTLTERWSLDDLPLRVDGATRIEDEVAIGAYVEVRGVLAEGGAVHVERIRTR